MGSRHLVIMAVFAHPADVVAEAGGTLALHADAGDRVVAVLLTHGGRIHPNIYVEEARKGEAGDGGIASASRERVIAIKRAEIDSAARILGLARVVCFELEDNMVGASPEVISRLADLMVEERPHILVTHHPGFHPALVSDHCVCGQIASGAATAAAHRFSNMDQRPQHFVSQIFYVSQGVSSRSTLVPGGGPANDVYIDISSVAERKVRAMDQFVSQGYDGDYARKAVSGHNGHWGSIAGVTFAEPFMRAHVETHRLLPVPSVLLERDAVTLHRSYSRDANLWETPVEQSPTRRGRR